MIDNEWMELKMLEKAVREKFQESKECFRSNMEFRKFVKRLAYVEEKDGRVIRKS